jgi:signal recognition particle receptor subunit beta
MQPPVSIAKSKGTVALIGYNSVGKTTALNAILKDNYSYISETKSTVGINYFRVIDKKLSSESERKGARTADSICCEIVKDNKAHCLLPLGPRKKVPKKKVFDTVATEPAFAAMDDTPLFFVDIPGIDLSNKDCPYRSHVDENFHTFDAIILVLDSNTDPKKQKRMLRYIRRNRSRIKTVPLIILANERSAHIGDSPQLSDLEVQVDEMFDIQSSDRVLQLDCIMSSFCGDLDCDGEETRNDMKVGDSIMVKPVFVPVKLHDAFRYRLTSTKLNLDQVSKLGASTIDKICQDEIGKEVWEKLSKDDRLDIVHSAISTPGDEYKLRETNFHTFLFHLERVLREIPKHQLLAQNPVVKENEESLFLSLTNFLCARKELPKQHHTPTIDELRGVGLGLADTLSEISSRDSVLEQDHIEVYMSSKTEYSDGTPDTDADAPVLEQRRRKWRNKRTAVMLMVAVVVLAITLVLIFVLFGYTVASME